MTLQATAGGLLSRFAHLTGGVAAKAKTKAEDDKNKDQDGPKDDKEAGADEDDGDDTTASTDEDQQDDDDNNKKEGKKARAARLDERARCSAIFSHPAAAQNTTLAAELAFNTDLSASAASALLAAAPAPMARLSGLSMRMTTVQPITIGADAAGEEATGKAAEAQALATSIVSAARASGVIRK